MLHQLRERLPWQGASDGNVLHAARSTKEGNHRLADKQT